MKIQNAELKDLQEIIILNKIVDYGNPDIYIENAVNNNRVLVVIKDTKIVGFTLYEKVWGNTPLLALIKIHPDYQNNLVGTKLIKELEYTIKGEGFDFYCSSTVQDNILSRRFHLKQGFIESGILQLPHGGEVFYRKTI